MSIKVTIGESKTQESKPFPKLMKVSEGLSESYKNRGMIVYFERHGVGTVICNGENYKPFESGTNWSMGLFEDFNEPITLQND